MVALRTREIQSAAPHATFVAPFEGQGQLPPAPAAWTRRPLLKLRTHVGLIPVAMPHLAQPLLLSRWLLGLPAEDGVDADYVGVVDVGKHFGCACLPGARGTLLEAATGAIVATTAKVAKARSLA